MNYLETQKKRWLLTQETSSCSDQSGKEKGGRKAAEYIGEFQTLYSTFENNTLMSIQLQYESNL